MRILSVTFIVFLLISFKAQAIHFNIKNLPNKNWSPDDLEYDGAFTCNEEHCLELSEIIDRSLLHGFEQRSFVERLFQARMNIVEAIGNLVPHIDFSVGHALYPKDIFGVITGLVGFLIPSNWFNWKESKLFYQAERYSFQVLLKDRVLSSETLYYGIHKTKIDYEIYKHYAFHLNSFIDFLKENINRLKIKKQDIWRLKNLHSSIELKMIKVHKVIKNILPQLAYAFNYDRDWGQIGIRPMQRDQWPDLESEDYISAGSNISEVLSSEAPDIQAINYLQLASKYSYKERIFDFFCLGNDNNRSFGINLGLGYVARLKVAKSHQRKLDIQKEKTIAALKESLYKTVNNYNTAIDLHKRASEAEYPNKEYFQHVVNNLENNKPFSSSHFENSVKASLSYDLVQNLANHLFLTSRAALNNLTRRGDIYENISQFMPPKRPRLHRWHDRHIIKENKRINKAINKGQLKE